MKQVILGLMAVGLSLGCVSAQAATSLAEVTPKNIHDGTFRLTCKSARNHTVEFVIHRDIQNVTMPDRAGYVSTSIDGNRIGTRVKREQHGKTQVYRFSLPEIQVAGSHFTLWGYGAAAGEPGVTYQFHLDSFWKPEKDGH